MSRVDDHGVDDHGAAGAAGQSGGSALDDPLPASPLPLLRSWLEQARASSAIRNPDAMALSTVDSAGLPEVRFVLCRGFDEVRGRFGFFTHYTSAKGRALEREGYASAAIYWDPLGRQVRISGRVSRSPESVSDAYFATRPPLSQLAAWASAQSEPIENRARLEARLEEARAEHGEGGEGREISRPPDWGGFTIEAEKIELWSERPGRLHDRALWTRALAFPPGEGREAGVWTVQRLQP